MQVIMTMLNRAELIKLRHKFEAEHRELDLSYTPMGNYANPGTVATWDRYKAEEVLGIYHKE